MTIYRRGKHSVTLLHTHLVFVTKYRRKIFNKEHLSYFQEICEGVAKKMNFKILEINGESDHVHLLVEYPPKISVSQLVNSLKGVSSRMLRKKYNLSPHKQHLWSPSYFAVSCGGAPLDKIKHYISSEQKSP